MITLCLRLCTCISAWGRFHHPMCQIRMKLAWGTKTIIANIIMSWDCKKFLPSVNALKKECSVHSYYPVHRKMKKIEKYQRTL